MSKSMKVGDSVYLFSLTEAERQTTLKALAELALRFPGWDDHIAEIANRLQGREMWTELKKYRRAGIEGGEQ